MSAAFTQFVVAALARDQASVLAAYVNGTLSARSWEHAATIWLVVALAVPLLAALAQPVALTEMGDELADSLGARATRTRTAAITLSVVLAAGAVSVAGPIAFVSLTAPQIARRLTRLAGPNLVVSALVVHSSSHWPTLPCSTSRSPTGFPSESPPWPWAASTWASCWYASGGEEHCEPDRDQRRTSPAAEQDFPRRGLRAEHLTLGYGTAPVVRDLTVDIAEGEFVAIVGPNGCGKSTLLKALGRVLRPLSGRVLLHGRDIRKQRSKDVARQLALLPQNPAVPEGITVRSLAARGRHPYHTLLRQWSPDDEAAIDQALELTGLAAHANSLVETLSGGQRQRAWVAMILAQNTGTILLDNHHVPRHRPPVRPAGTLRRLEPAGPHCGRGAPRPRASSPVRQPPHRRQRGTHRRRRHP